MIPVHLVGAAWGKGAPKPGCADGPAFLIHQHIAQTLEESGIQVFMEPLISEVPEKDLSILCAQLARQLSALVNSGKRFIVLGGDHSCAIGTWQGVSDGLQNSPGLIWIDAHMDAHTPQTSPSGAVHGMPLAVLLGLGSPDMVGLLDQPNPINPEHLCLIGVRSFESQEKNIIDQFGIRVFYKKECTDRGLPAIFRDALEIVQPGNRPFGISIDLDAIDPTDAPGVGSPVANGLVSKNLLQALQSTGLHPNFLGLEIAEFNPSLDQDNKTALLCSSILKSVFSNP